MRDGRSDFAGTAKVASGADPSYRRLPKSPGCILEKKRQRMIQEILTASAALPGGQKAALWGTVTIVVSIAAFTAEIYGVPRAVTLAGAAVLIAPLVGVGTRALTGNVRREKVAT